MPSSPLSKSQPSPCHAGKQRKDSTCVFSPCNALFREPPPVFMERSEMRSPLEERDREIGRERETESLLCCQTSSLLLPPLHQLLLSAAQASKAAACLFLELMLLLPMHVSLSAALSVCHQAQATPCRQDAALPLYARALPA